MPHPLLPAHIKLKAMPGAAGYSSTMATVVVWGIFWHIFFLEPPKQYPENVI